MNKETVTLLRGMATATKTHMELLIQALDAAERFSGETIQQRQTIDTYIEELSVAKDRHVEDEATIHIKDSQLFDANNEISNLKVAFSNQNLLINEKDETINNLKNEVRKLQNELGVTEDEPA